MNNIIDAFITSGKAQKAQGQTFQSFLASLAVSVVLCGFVTSVHVIFRAQWLRLYGKSETVGVKGLDRLSFSNVGFSHPYLYWAHLVSAVFVAISVCLILQAELRSYSRFEESLGVQSTGSSILIVSSSKKPLDPKAIRRHFSAMFGGVQGITINRDLRLLDAKISRLDAWIAKLEAAETELVRKASRSKGMPAQPLLAQHSFVLLWKRYLLESAVSQIAYIVGIIPELAWLETLPSWMVPAIQGVLPPIMLAVWISLVPMAVRVLVNFQKLHSHQAVESSVQRLYFIFLFIQVFLVASLSSSITTVLAGLGSNAKSVPLVLAQNLPKASNYFFSYFILKASSTISITLICGEKLLNLLLSYIRDKTARQKWTRSEAINVKLWGTFVPD
ncbi:hypothetical protein VC83_03515 [Pseudogymnoascus destructans]|uniref:CSC1/OSCA1-like 7TM region domain-containing protein n=1 Tax=Pseudogymnoascus destructans TaxID=655981 RepID=A0A177AH27_9PEZI|nr:uncharacterized protein VC83_03515 [Pseudogymnoascus destructans]OAF60523.1 hypothetical protein VC83_03515 [Pseudogymnoascus destructans]